MLKVIRDLLRFDGRFRIAFIFLAIISAMTLASLVSPYDPGRTFVVGMDLQPSHGHHAFFNNRCSNHCTDSGHYLSAV